MHQNILIGHVLPPLVTLVFLLCFLVLKMNNEEYEKQYDKNLFYFIESKTIKVS